MHETIAELRRQVLARFPAADGADADLRFPMPRLFARVGPTCTPPLPALYEPMICFVLQGAKRVSAGGRTLDFRTGSFFVASVELPITGQVIEATQGQPYIAVALRLDRASLSALLLDLPPRPEGPTAAGIAISPITSDLAEPLLRLVRLCDSPADVPVLAPMAERELLYRLLLGPQGPTLRQIARSDSRVTRVRRAIDWIRGHYAEPLRVETLAGLAAMSPSAFHRHFKAVTAMTPLAYQKQIRLQEARRRLAAGTDQAARIAHAVGYESASQFSREYARQFGLPPARDAARLRGAGALEDA
ncbi:AraC family transcriptional regulator [Sphingosinicella terrae]|uniref:AraC family transcriptional regulator n=1 Tax=Sphingosinicella terrae TaxID=2172047 RepID=UPI000E0D51FA|nr:AraC family transcriptional regulator [Sphingosinicella terrae]